MQHHAAPPPKAQLNAQPGLSPPYVGALEYEQQCSTACRSRMDCALDRQKFRLFEHLESSLRLSWLNKAWPQDKALFRHWYRCPLCAH